MKNKKHFFFWIIIIIGTAVSAFLSVTRSATDIDMVIDLVILCLILACVAVPYFVGYGITRKLKQDFENAAQYLKSAETIKTHEIEEQLSNPALRQYYSSYLSAIRDGGSTEQIVVDIHDYFNPEMIDSITKKDFSEQISGALTGLGILGTFIGLSIGLAKFNLGKNMDTNEMQTSISSLMNGIRAAFYTSIFGVGFSIVTNFFIKIFYADTYDALDAFLTAFEEHAVSSPQNSILKTLVTNQEMQTAHLSKFAGEIAEAFSLQMQTTLTPVIERLNSSIDVFIEKSVASHNESLGLIVNSFVESMNASMGDQFTALGTTLATLNQTQLENSSRLQKIVDDICTNGAYLQTTNEMLNETVEQLSGFMNQLNTMQTNLMNANSDLLKQVQNLGDLSEKQAAALTAAKVEQEVINRNITKMNDILASYQAVTDNLRNAVGGLFSDLSSKLEMVAQQNQQKNAEYLESIKTIASESTRSIANQSEVTKHILEDVVAQTSAAFDKINQISNDQNQIIAESFAKAIDQSSTILNTQMARATEISEKMDLHMQRSAATLSKAYKELETDISRVLKNTFDSFDEQISQIAQHFSGTLKQSDETISHMDRYMQTAPESLYAVIDKLILEMKKAIAELNRVKEQ